MSNQIMLTSNKNKIIYAKIHSLDYNDNIVETIEGQVSGGSINFSGTSSSRRTCSISLVSSQINLHTYYWSLKTKFKLYIGVANSIDEMPIWYNFGHFIISSFNSSETSNSFTISLQGQDKMSLLDGTLGGTITALSVDFGTVDIEQSDGSVLNKKLPIKEIISSAVHTYAKEPFFNIIINDLEDFGVELMEYRHDEPLYVIINENTDEPSNVSLNPDQGPYYDAETGERYTLGTIPIYNPIVNGLISEEEKYTKVKSDLLSDNVYSIAKIEYGMTCGYRFCDLVYAGDLILNAGETITNLLDRIVTMLGNFEYLYDEDGRFIFRHKQAYAINNWWKNVVQDVDGEQSSETINNQIMNFEDSNIYTSASVYEFKNNELVTSLQNAPSLSNLKNDYSIWGTREGVSGTDLPIHFRYSINTKPDWYKSFENKIYSANNAYENYIRNKFFNKDEEEILEMLKDIVHVDWREIMYQMALDYNKYHLRDDYNIILFENNPWASEKGITGYEQYYEDMIGFWRQLYCPIEEREDSYSVVYLTKERFDKNKTETDENYIEYYYQEPIYHQCSSEEPFHSTYQYYNEDKKPITKLTIFAYMKNPSLYYYIKDYKWASCNRETIFNKDTIYYMKDIDSNFTEDSPWNINILQHPETLNFWIDFLDASDSELNKYSVKAVGNRSKSVNDNTVKGIYFRETPLIAFVNNDSDDFSYVVIELTEESFSANKYYIKVDGVYQLASQWDEEQLYYQKTVNRRDGYVYIYLPDYLENLFIISSQGKSAKDVIDEYLYTYAYCIEQINLSVIPVYDLQINTRIIVKDDTNNINGEYIVNSISLSLGHSGLMSITATKAVDSIF